MSTIKSILNDIKTYWRSDLLAGFSVSLVALPLSIGIAIAMELPVSALMAGITAAMVGGLISTFFKSGNISINGPSPALIGIVIGAMSILGSWEFVLAAFVCSGILQFAFGVFKLGKLGDFIPSSVVQGMMAAIGVIILGSQIHTGLGVSFKGSNDWENIVAIPQSILNMNPLIAIIFANSLLILAWHPHVKNKFVKYVPAPIWLLLISIPLYMLFQYFIDGQITLFGSAHTLNPTQDLITLPENLFAGFLTRPNFNKIYTVSFWLVVLSVFLVSTIETLGSAKAIDKIDPLKRKTNLNQDVAAMGISTLISGLIGGLPVIAVIARSSVNINHEAKTRLSNFVHGALILLFVFLLAPYIQMVPKAALMAILVYTGYKLASPKVFKDASLKGYEQFMILSITLVSTLFTDLNKGILIGILSTIVIHLIRSHLPATLFFKYLAKPYFNLARIDDHYHMKIKGVANFTNVLKIRSLLLKIPANDKIIFDFSHTRLVDFSMLEFVSEWGKDYVEERKGAFEIIGLDEHLTTSEHPYSIHALPQMLRKPLSRRQKDLKEFCFENGWNFDPKTNWNIDYLKTNKFFVTRPIEYAKNQIKGTFTNGVSWEILDITFDEGALMTAEVHNATMMRLCFNQNVPDFKLDNIRLFSRLLNLAVKEDIYFGEEDNFSNEFSVKGANKEEIKLFFNKDLKRFLKKNNKYHIESANNEMLVFRYFRVMGTDEIESLIGFSEKLAYKIQKRFETPSTMP